MRVLAVVVLLVILTLLSGLSRAAWELGRHNEAIGLWAVSLVLCLSVAAVLDWERRQGQ